ncbi:MAG TPA: cytochrome c1 [Alphaproteobacteria bacterium]|jgi:ubiquinol-cytochrome c reductase cytochrome c1 subunit|nr:cytochrome c1 [Alphaproteobacteria bacterium]HBA44297.1 cytochrome c1 [Alphaproteobacteria bacterium]HBC53243.1 cytochrome c1 [Alphaproteobacteria bacterium]HBF97734.1 cytochrome c1 [Alphaproteobacteria bacterium]HCO91989.1 cytochrome c1 [Alphaproteobacteria bacterium]
MIQTLRAKIRPVLIGLALSATITLPAQAAGGAAELKDVDWHFSGPFGSFDKDALRRGLQVYREVCASCHSLKFVAYRNLGDAGGPALSEAEIKAIAAEYEVTDGPDSEGDMFERPAEPKDKFVPPFANEQAARASNNGAYPPDLSLMTKARKNGPNHVYSILTGYQDAPEGVEIGDGMNYNPYFSGGQIAMAQPLFEDQVEYEDGTPATVEQMSKDVVEFLHWAAEPKLEHRKRLGFKVMIFLIVFAGLLYAVKRRVWENLH